MSETAVFIAFSRDSDEHCERVSEFARSLIAERISVTLDRSPLSEGHRRWLNEQLRPETHPFILVICTPSYQNSQEAAAIGSYFSRPDVNERLIPILFDDAPVESIASAILRRNLCRIGEFRSRDDRFAALVHRLRRPGDGAEPALVAAQQGKTEDGALRDAEMERLTELHAALRRIDPPPFPAAFGSQSAAAAAPDVRNSLKDERLSRSETLAPAPAPPRTSLPPPPAESGSPIAERATESHSYASSPAPPVSFGGNAAPMGRSSRKALWIAGLLIGVGAAAFAARYEFAGVSVWLAKLLRLGAQPPPLAARGGAREIDVSAFAPARSARGAAFLVQAFAHLSTASPRSVAALAREGDPEARRRGVATLDIAITSGDRLDFVLEGRGLAVAEPHQSFVWSARSRGCAFVVNVPEGFSGENAHLKLRVFRNATPIGSIGFAMAIEDATPAPPLDIVGETATRYRRAFLSYASSDRAEVLKRAQGLRAAGLDFFQDLLSLEPGERWERRLFTEIDRCDLFLLFWSRAASDSSWVRREISYARDKAQAGGHPLDILPILLEGPPPPAPPDGFGDLHFNDPLLYLIAALEALETARPASKN